MKLFNNDVEVLWAMVRPPNFPKALDLLIEEPERVIPNMIRERNKNTAHLKCPAFTGFYKNTFLVRSPINLDIRVNDLGYIESENTYPYVIDALITLSGSKETDVYPALQIKSASMVFFSKEPVEIQQLHAVMEPAEYLTNIRTISGSFDISKWVRPLSFGFEVIDRTKPINIKRGDPMFYVKFVTEDGRNVRLKRVEFSEDLNSLVDECVGVQQVVRNNTMKENYTCAANRIKRFWATYVERK